MKDRAILHCDMNNFFASVECVVDSSLNGKPVAVCGNVKERHGIVMARNYMAKDCGVKVAEPIWQALKKCKDLVVVNTPHFEEYEKFSKKAHDIYREYTDMVEPFGIDECWLDVTNSIKLFGEPVKIANEIRNRIKKELGLTISVGVSFNKVFAKFGSDYKKPDATTVISRENFKEMMWARPTSDMIGVGQRTKKILDDYFIYTIGGIANETIERLTYLLGTNGALLYKYANGLDDSVVSKYEDSNEIKSVSHGITTIHDLKNKNEVWVVMLELSQEIAYKLRNKHLRTSCIQVAIRDENLIWQRFQKKLNTSEQSAYNISKFAFELFNERYSWTYKVRTITIAATNLIDENEPEAIRLFDDKLKQDKIEKAEKCMESINLKYGDRKVKNASLMDTKEMPQKRRKVNYGKK